MTKYLTYEAWDLDREPGPDAVDRDCAGDWLAKWAPPCPEGKFQRLAEITGFRLKAPDYLQLRVILRDDDESGCHVVVDEHESCLYVRAMAHTPELARGTRYVKETDCPCNYWLDAPLGERVVIDVDTGAELPFFIPRWGEGLPSLYVPRPPGDLCDPDLDAILSDRARVDDPPSVA
jgi:hypothetical protein